MTIFIATLVNPWDRKISDVLYDDKLDNMRDLLSHPKREVKDLSFYRYNTTLQFCCDDMAGFSENIPIFYLKNYPHPVPGNILFLGCNEMGETLTIFPSEHNLIVSSVSWSDFVTTGTLTPMTNEKPYTMRTKLNLKRREEK